MKKLHFFITVLCLGMYANLLFSNELAIDTLNNEIEIWPGTGPGSENLTINEHIIVRGLSGTCTRDWAIDSITVPTITPLVPDTPNGAAVIICPGGAYRRVVYDVEGMDIGRWLNSIGITAFVLKYRLPDNEHVDKKNVPLQDAQRAMRYIRANAAKWDLDTTKIGISGASAGGHVATTLATSYNKQVYTPKDTIDNHSARPDFVFLLYPVVSMESDITHIGSRDILLGINPAQELINEFSAEKNVTSQTPKTFFAHSETDGSVSPENSKRLHLALVDSGIVSSELKLFKSGSHGVGICKAGVTEFKYWPLYCTNWLFKQGLTGDSVEIIIPEPDKEDNDSTNAINSSDIKNKVPFNIYPNPINTSSKLLYQVKEISKINISVIDLTGKLLIDLINKEQEAGNYCLSFPCNFLNSKGVFLLKYQDNSSVWVQKFLIN